MEKSFPLSSKTSVALSLSLFWVLTHWGFWDKGVLALGWNASVFWLGLLIFLFVQSKERNLKKMGAWFIPLVLMALSFGLFENPWLKGITILILPTSTAVFYTYGQIKDGAKKWWGFHFICQILNEIFSLFLHVQEAGAQILSELFFLKKDQHRQRFKSIALGLGILILLLGIVVLPLLKSADTEFSNFLTLIFDGLFEVLEWDLIWRIVLFGLLSIGLMDVFLAWTRSIDLKESPKQKPLDNWIAGILLGGLLFFYIIFVYFQLDKVLVGTLPIDLSNTLNLVKSGFWQLFFLSIINGFLFLIFYHKTDRIPQAILKAFILVSGLILVSAAWRMALYVSLYGFSYEKFFAAYTTLFGLIFFVILLWASFKKTPANIFKILSFMALWFYSVATILPIESMILKSNIALSHMENSRINMYELTMLSSDVYQEVKEHYNTWDTDEVKAEGFWLDWFQERNEETKDRAWYETNLSFELNKN